MASTGGTQAGGFPPTPSIMSSTNRNIAASRTLPVTSKTNEPQDQASHENENEENLKSAKELERSRQKIEKAQKFAAKQSKVQLPPKAKSKDNKKREKSQESKLSEYIDETPKGQKKFLKPFDDPLHSAYIPKVVESSWYEWWEAQGFFKPEITIGDSTTEDQGYFVIPQPPPNVTGALHCGHAMAAALQDAMIRWHRMKGLATLYIPGCDHAGISTQSVVEKMLWRRHGKTRHDLGREKFVELVWEWKEEYHTKINHVLRRMGGSYDWTREAFTMDQNLSAAVVETFCRLHDEGLIYRSNRLVNWCTQLNTALSNLEVINLEIPGRTLLVVPGYDRKVEFGVITHFKYPISDSEETIEVATTRPETMLGDTGIAVHPEDARYRHLIGKNARHPFVDRLLPIVADSYVDPEFGTGAVKITPAHDPNDFELGKRHGFEFLNILNDDGTMNHNAGIFEGQKRFDARYTVVEELTKLGLFAKKANNPMKVPICEKSKDIIEPLMKPQWWMKMRDMADEATKVVKEGKVKIRPASAAKSYFRWMESTSDWCLSRQLWWGHQIPAYSVKIAGKAQDQEDHEAEVWITGRTEAEAYKKAAERFPGKGLELTRDPDVLDTWFSSGLWPFSTLGWPEETADLKNFYPTSMLETGWDILFFWVARMIMLGIKLTGKVPFYEVYCHSLVRDTEGRKMSKSLGNVIDPVDVMEGIELKALHDKLLTGNLDPKEIANATKFQKTAFPIGIPECGADALRFCLIQYCTGGGDINFDVNVMHGYRKFCNKLYQATKYVVGKFAELGDSLKLQSKPGGKTNNESLPERWILHKLSVAARDVNQALTDREFSRATQILYQYCWDHLCDVYIENSKSIIRDGSEHERVSAARTLYTALEGSLRLLHPFMPFITEELWQRLPRRPHDTTPSIMVASYPQFDGDLEDTASEVAYELVLGCSKAIRSLVSEYSITEGAQAYILAADSDSHRTATDELASIKALSGKASPSITVVWTPPRGCAVSSVSAEVSVFLDVKDHVNLDEEVQKAETKAQKAGAAAVKVKKIIEAPDFTAKSSSAVQATEQKRLADLLAQQNSYERSAKEFRLLSLDIKQS